MASLLRSDASSHSAGYWLRLVAIGLLAGFAVIVLTPAIADAGRKFIALGLIGIVILITAIASRRGRDVFLVVWIISLTYNRQFWSFAPIVGDHGAFGPYWMISDLVLLALLARWMYESVILKLDQQVHSVPVMRWYLPFVIAAGLSIAGAPEPAWALGDFSRLLKLGLVLLYFRYQIGPRQWWVVVAALGAAAVIQSVFGVLEVVTGRTGVLGILGIGIDVRQILGVTELFGGWTRATGTVAHPPYLAAFLLLTVPVFTSLGLTQPWGLKKWLCLGVAALGLVGIVCTLTRFPIVVAMLQVMLLIIILVATRMLSITRVIALGAVAGLILSIIGMYGAEFIYERMTGDFTRSVDARFEGYKVAGRMLLDHPVFGVGLNNYGAYMPEYDPGELWSIKRKWHDISLNLTHMRLLAGPLNGYLYVATVTGLVGLAAFLWFALGGIVLGLRAIRANARDYNSETESFAYSPKRAACVGMLVGLVGLYIAQITSYSIWIDTVFSVWVILVALLGCAGYRSPSRDTEE